MSFVLRVVSEALAPGRSIASIAATVVTRAVLVAVAMATTIVVARQLGPVGRGEYAVAIAITGIGVQLANLGLHTSSSWVVARSPYLLGQLLANGLVIAGVLGIGTAAAGWIMIYILPGSPALPASILGLALAAIPIGLVYLIGQNLLLGLQRIRDYNLLELGNRTLAFAGVGALAIAGALTSTLAVGATVAALSLAMVVTILVLQRRSTTRVRPHPALIRQFGGYGVRAYLSALFTFLVLRSDFIITERLKGSGATGEYSIAVSIAELATLPAVVTATILFPRLSAMTADAQRWRSTARAATTAAVVTAVVAVAIVPLIDPVIAAVFGQEFLPSVEPTVWLLPGAVAFAVHTVVASYFYSVGTPAITIAVPLIALLANVALDLLLIPDHGIVGAAIASTMSYTLMLALTGLSFVLRRG